jgi:hypothetical protein
MYCLLLNPENPYNIIRHGNPQKHTTHSVP